MKPEELYKYLENHYGPQGWWPLQLRYGSARNGYHPEFPVIDTERKDKYEIILGAVLTQNTAWGNVNKALQTLFLNGIDSPEKFIQAPEEEIKKMIRPSGYYNQKYLKLKKLFVFFLENDYLGKNTELLSREKLLEQWGIGEETSDSILLYGYNRPLFVVDAYTKRLLFRISGKKFCNYKSCQQYFHENLLIDLKVYNEYHALIVKHSVEICKKTPLCGSCFLYEKCNKYL